MANAQEIGALVLVISKAYPTFEADKERVGLFVEMLSDVPIDALKAAVRQHIATNKWPPTIAELREGATVVTRPALPAWSDAWDEVLTAIRSVGYMGKPSFSHPLISQAVQGMGGWQTMCQMTIDETATWRAQFRDVFNAYAHRATQTANLLPDVRKLAEQYGALPAPAATVPALPAPTEQGVGPMAANQPIKFAEYVTKWREAGRAEREAHGRKVAEEASQEAVHA